MSTQDATSLPYGAAHIPRAEATAPGDATEIDALRREVTRLREQLALERASRIEADDRRALAERHDAEAMATRDDFLSAAAHDLKTPLAALRLQVQGLARRDLATIDGEQLRKRLRAMDRQSAYVTELLERLLEFSRGEDHPMDLAPHETDLAEVVADVLERCKDDLAWARCAVTIDLPDAPVVGLWDRMRLHQVVMNLVSNAMKYGGRAPIRVTLQATDERAILTIADSGVGIAPEALASIFDKYARANPTRSISGLGLGLWIVRRIVERIGGQIRVESQLGSGSTFTLDLPRTPPAPP